MSKVVYINGEFVPEEQAKISVLDHGLLYGDGAFEGIRAYSGRVWKLREHIARLYSSAHALSFELCISQEEMVDVIRKVLRANGLTDGYIRPVITRGFGLGLDPRICDIANIIVMADKLSLYPKEMYEKGLEVVTVSTRVLPPQCIEPRIKSLGKYVGNIQAKHEANRMGAGEGIMLNLQGHVAEATGDNIFLVRNGVLITPPPYVGILEGITRNAVMDIAKNMGIEVKEVPFTMFDLYTADECFLTGTAAEVIPVAMADGRAIGTGKVGDMTKKLIEAFHKQTQIEGVDINP
ncbi:MAG TPA: branched-chain-amino-acid transaminase [Armatimonadota bacterium]|jgi:branched-chain amino acid aminotransferase